MGQVGADKGTEKTSGEGVDKEGSSNSLGSRRETRSHKKVLNESDMT